MKIGQVTRYAPTTDGWMDDDDVCTWPCHSSNCRPTEGEKFYHWNNYHSSSCTQRRRKVYLVLFLSPIVTCWISIVIILTLLPIGIESVFFSLSLTLSRFTITSKTIKHRFDDDDQVQKKMLFLSSVFSLELREHTFSLLCCCSSRPSSISRKSEMISDFRRRSCWQYAEVSSPFRRSSREEKTMMTTEMKRKTPHSWCNESTTYWLVISFLIRSIFGQISRRCSTTNLSIWIIETNTTRHSFQLLPPALNVNYSSTANRSRALPSAVNRHLLLSSCCKKRGKGSGL